MNPRPDTRLVTKLGAAFAAVVLLMAVQGAVGLGQLATIDEHMEAIAGNSLVGVQRVGEIQVAAGSLRRAEADLVLAADEGERDAIEKRLAAAQRHLAELQAAYEPLIGAADERAAYAAYQQRREAYLASLASTLAKARQGAAAPEAARAQFHDQGAQAFDALAGALASLAEVNLKHADETHEQAQSTYVHARAWTIGLVLVAVGAAALLASLIVRSVTRQLGGEPGAAAGLARHVALGDLRETIQLHPGDSTSMMAQLRAMRHSLSEVVSGVRLNADSVATASAQIAQGNADLSSRTGEPASAPEQSAATAESLKLQALQLVQAVAVFKLPA